MERAILRGVPFETPNKNVHDKTAMTNHDDKRAEDPRPTYSAEKGRQGEIILRTRTQRVILIAGLAGAVLLALAMSFFLR